MRPSLRLLLLLLAWTALGRTVAWGQVCATPGKDGSPGALSGVVNTYFPGTGTAASGGKSISVAAVSGATGTGITPGDLLLVIQMQGADINGTDGTAYGANNGTGTGNLTTNFTAGTYEYVVAGSSLATGAAGTITTTTNLANTYSAAAATATAGRRSFQVVRIPQYTNVTLGGQVNAAVWNGNTGGILAMDVAGTLTLAGQTLNATASGFRGGAGIQYTGNAAAGGNNTTYRTPSTVATTTTGVNGTKGEGTAGTPRYTAIGNATLVDNTTALANAFASGVTNGYANGDNGRGAPGNAGGGATDAQSPNANGYNAGGAGGGNGASGGFGGSPRNPNGSLTPGTPVLTVRALGGVAFAATSTRLVMGGGGGAGSNNDGIGPNGNVNNGIGSSGSAGGGIILVRVGSLSGTGTASAAGDGGYLISGTGSDDGTGGGGAGGTVLVTARNTAGLANLTVLATGGAGNNNRNTLDVAHGPGGGGSGGVILANGALAAATSAAGGAAGTTTYGAIATSSTFGATAGADGTTTTNITTPITNSVAGADCIADVSVSLTAPGSTNVGQTVSVQATFSNIGAAAAASTARTVTLPAGTTVTSAPGGTIAVNGGTGVTTVTYPTTTLNAGDAATFTINYMPSAATANTTVTVTAAISTTTPEAGLTANNSASAGTSVSTLGAVGTPAPCATPGKDGSPTVATNPNTYYPATASAAAGATSITVGAGTLGSTAASATTISNGDLLLVIQMQGADINSTNTNSYGDGVAGGGASGNLTTNFTAGTYEYVVATNTTPINVTAGGTITLASALVNGYVSAAASATAGARRFQVVRVPQYASLTLGANLTATPWNGSIGGIIALDVAGQTSFGGNTIDASGAGFRGGAGRTLTTSTDATSYLTTAASNNNAQKGEGTAGTPQYVNNNGTLLNTNVDGYPGGSSGRGAPGNAGGGGDDNSFNSGGGGGANGGAGGRGGNTYKNNLPNGGEPGASFGVASSSRLVLGGGGGAGSTNEGTGTPNNGFASSGSAGGGLVILRTGSVSGTGSILANAAPTNNTALNDGAGGGGAGGSILVTAGVTSGLSGLTLSANGSNGGNNKPATNGGTAHGPGGGGGGGVILTNGTVASSSAAAGLTGQTTYSTVDGNSNSPTATIAYGAAPGSAGVSNFQISTSIANSTAGATCRPAPVANNITNTSRPGGQAAAPVNGLSATTFGTIASYTISGLDASQGTYYVNDVVLNATNFPGLVLTAAQAGQLSFAPAASFSGTSSFSYTATDDLGVVSTNTATYTVPVTATGASGAPAPCASAGKDGSPTVAANPNAYYPGSASQTLNVGATSIAVGASTGAATNITAGDLLLVIQMQGADINSTNTDSYGDGVAGGGASGNLTTNFTAGTYEYVVATNTVTATAGGTINLASGLKNSYVNAAATATTGQRTFQVIRVPQYANLTLGASLTATPWNGTSGGIIVLDVAGQLNLAGFTIDASGAGFRGGAGRLLGGMGDNSGLAGTDYRQLASVNTSGQKGEGTAGTPQYVNNNGTLLNTNVDGYPSGSTGRGAPGNAGGGGTDTDPVDNSQNDGGGGGANGGRGGRGGDAWASNAASGGEPGTNFAATSTSRLVLGGGGGAGSTNNGTGSPGAGFASSGAAGGGLVIVRTGSVTGSGSILANGASASNTVANDGSGGGGAGGSILLTAVNTAGLANVTLTATGGSGGTNDPGGATAHGPGGGGGGGVIFTNGTVAAATVTAGANGTTKGGVAFGAAPGLGGVSNTSVSASIANSVAGATCPADVATTITGPATANAGQPTGTFTATFSNVGTGLATNVAQTVTLPTGAGLSAAQQAAIKSAYPNATFTITGSGASTSTTINFGTLATLAGGASNAYSFAYTAPATPGTVTTVSTTSASPADANTANNTASVSTTVATAADVTVALNGPTTLYAGQPTGNFTATFTNEGPGTATNVTRTITLPAGAMLTGAQLAVIRITSPSATYSSATNVIDFGPLTSLASDANSTVTFAFTAPPALGSSNLTGNTSTVTAEGSNSAPNQTTLALNTVAAADVVAAITASNTATTGTFNVTFSNNGPQSAAGVVRTVQLPAGLTGVTITGDPGSYDSTTGLVTYSTSPTTIAANGSLTSAISYSLASSATPVAATATVSTTTSEAGQTANNTKTALMPASYDLATTLTGPATTIVGSPTMLYVTTTNKGPNNAPVAAQTVVIPSAGPLTNVYITNGGTYTYNTDSGLGTVTFPNVTNLPAGQTITNNISFSAPSSSFAPSATVTGANGSNSGDTNTANNTANLNGSAAGTQIAVTPATTNQSNVATAIVADKAIVNANAVVTYTVTATNKGNLNNPATSNVAELVQLLPGLTTSTLTVGGVTGTAVGNVIQYVTAAGTTTYDPATGIVTYPVLASLSSGATTTYDKLAVTVPANAGNNGQLLATASVSTAQSDPNPADNTSSVVVKVQTPADLATTLTGPTTATAGQTTSYTATFVNRGTGSATNVVETVQLPAGLSNVLVQDANGNVVNNAYNATTGLVTIPTVANMAAGTSQVYGISFVAPAQSFPLTSSISSGTTDPTTTNNSALLRTTVSPTSDVAVYVSGPATAVAGNGVTYAVTTANNGPNAASNVQATLQLPANLTGVTLTGGGSYDAASGLVTFPSVNLAAGDSRVGLVNFTMPASPTNGQVSGAASVTTSSTDVIASNNTAGITTDVAPATSDMADLVTGIVPPASPAAAGSAIRYTLNFRNNGPAAATKVMPTAYLPAGLSNVVVRDGSGNIVPNAYNSSTGQITLPTIDSQVAGQAGVVSYTVDLTAPANAVTITASSVSSNTSDPTPGNNTIGNTLNITPVYDVVTSLAGPTSAQPGSVNTYTLTTTNNGPSTSSATAGSTTQSVTVPAGSVVAGLPAGANYDSGTGVITFLAISSQAAGPNGAVSNTFTVQMPASGSLGLTATITASGESNTTNDQATLTTAPANQAPVAQNMWNTLQSARGNTANLAAPTGMLISPLNATDLDGTVSSYTVTTLPAASQGVLYLANGSAVAVGQTVPANGLYFAPNPNFVGNATFTYQATDNGTATSNQALYTIPVAQDQNSVYTAYNSGKGTYATGEILAQAVDANAAIYNSSGTMYNTAGVLQSGASNGLANAVIASGTLPTGVSIDPATGRIFVSNASALPKLTQPTSYSLQITTTDANGGTSTVPVTFTIGATPLPVVLVEFTAQAVANRDALLGWSTASEKNSDHFEVERSFDGTSFVKIGQLAGHGTTASASAYTFTDAGVAAQATGPVYYRLRQVDLDGTATYSPQRTISFTKAVLAKLALFPNPVAERTTLDLGALPAAGSYQAQLLDATGRQVQTWTALAGGVAHPLEVAGLASGSYLLVVTGQQPDGSLLKQTLRLTKE